MEVIISKVILCAGMPRSGSTWLYNVVRLAFGLSGSSVGAGWVRDFEKFENKEVVVLKTHEIDGSFSPEVVLYSYRDLRDVVASYKRQSGNVYTMTKLNRFISLDTHWKKQADFIMRYEVMIKCPRTVIEGILKVLRLDDVSIYNILVQMDRIIYPDKNLKGASYDKVSLYHPRHITNGNSNSWEDDIDEDFILSIEKQFGSWFKQNGYRAVSVSEKS